MKKRLLILIAFTVSAVSTGVFADSCSKWLDAGWCRGPWSCSSFCATTDYECVDMGAKEIVPVRMKKECVRGDWVFGCENRGTPKTDCADVRDCTFLQDLVCSSDPIKYECYSSQTPVTVVWWVINYDSLCV